MVFLSCPALLVVSGHSAFGGILSATLKAQAPTDGDMGPDVLGARKPLSDPSPSQWRGPQLPSHLCSPPGTFAFLSLGLPSWSVSLFLLVLSSQLCLVLSRLPGSVTRPGPVSSIPAWWADAVAPTQPLPTGLWSRPPSSHPWILNPQTSPGLKLSVGSFVSAPHSVI